MPITAALIGAGGAIIGSSISGGMNRSSARSAQAANIEAMKNRHQWEVADLKAAGLNPILSAKHGGTAGMPGVSTTVPDLGPSMAQGLTSAAGVMKSREEVEKIQQEVQNLSAQYNLTQEQVKVASKQIHLIRAQTMKTFAEKRRINYENIPLAMRTKFLQDNEFLVQARAAADMVGIDLRDFINLFKLVGFKGNAKGINK
jgi:hypothetical protein